VNTWHRDISDLGISVHEGALLSTAFFILLALWLFKTGHEFGWQLALVGAGSALSVWITLEIVEHAIREDRNQQWMKVKSLTYMTIINDIRYIVVDAPVDSDEMMIRVNLINGDINYPSEFTTNIIKDIAKDMRIEYKQANDRLDELYDQYGFDEDKLKELDEFLMMDTRIKSYESYCKMVDYLIQDLRINLIPRTLLLSSDQDINLALTKFEAFYREYQQDLRMGFDFSDNYTHPAVRLVEELSDLYDTLQKNMPSGEENITYQFKDPGPFL